MIYGSDVSKWQGIVPWSAFASKESFTFMKATEGALALGTPDAQAIKLFGLDPTFRENRAQAEAHGLFCGFYHFLRVDLGNSPENEAVWFVSVVGTLKPGQFVALDAEEPASQDAVGRFLRTVKRALGVEPFFYTYRSWPAAHGVTYAGLKTYGVDPGLWLSAPDGPVPAPPVGGWPFTAIQQRNSGTVDGDIFFGTLPQLLAYAKPGLTAGAGSGSAPPSPSPSSPQPPAPVPTPTPTPASPTPPQEVPPVQNPPTPIDVPPLPPEVTPPPVPEPPIIAEQGVTTSEWTALVRYGAQAAGLGTAQVVNTIAESIWHVGVNVPMSVQLFVGGLEIAGAVAVAGYAISRGIRKLHAQ